MIEKVEIFIKHKNRTLKKVVNFSKDNWIAGEEQTGKTGLLNFVSLLFISDLEKAFKDIEKMQINFLNESIVELFSESGTTKIYENLERVRYTFSNNKELIFYKDSLNNKVNVKFDKDVVEWSNFDYNSIFDNWPEIQNFWLKKKRESNEKITYFDFEKNKPMHRRMYHLVSSLQQGEKWLSKSNLNANLHLPSKVHGSNFTNFHTTSSIDKKWVDELWDKYNFFIDDFNSRMRYKEIHKVISGTMKKFNNVSNEMNYIKDNVFQEISELQSEIMHLKSVLKGMKSDNKQQNNINSRFETYLSNPFTIIKNETEFNVWDLYQLKDNFTSHLKRSESEISDMEKIIGEKNEMLNNLKEKAKLNNNNEIVEEMINSFLSYSNSYSESDAKSIDGEISNMKKEFELSIQADIEKYNNDLSLFMDDFINDEKNNFTKSQKLYLSNNINDSTKQSGTGEVIHQLLEHLFYAKSNSLPIVIIDTPFKSENNSKRGKEEKLESSNGEGIDYFDIISKIIKAFRLIDTQLIMATANQDFIRENKTSESLIDSNILEWSLQ